MVGFEAFNYRELKWDHANVLDIQDTQPSDNEDQMNLVEIIHHPHHQDGCKNCYQTAVIYDDDESGSKEMQSLTYKDLWDEIRELENGLADFLSEYQTVGVLLLPSCSLPSVLLSILSNHCCFFPMNPDGLRYSIKGLKKVKASWILVQSFYEKLVLAELNDSYTESLSNSILFKYNLKLLKLCRDEPSLSSTTTNVCPLAYCITTSGTTSSPKVVKVPHSCISPNVLSIKNIFRVKSSDKILLTSPLTFDPSIIDIFICLSSGATLLIVSEEVKKNPTKLLHTIYNRHSVTIMQATPSLVGRFSPRQLKETLLGPNTQLRVLALGGEPFPSGQEMSSWVDPANETTQFFNLYGITEVSCWASCQPVDIKLLIEQNKPVPIGKALDKTILKLSSNSSCGRDIGNIFIGSAERVCVIDEEAVIAASEKNSIQRQEIIWRDTGDLGRLMPDGNILYIGRKDDQIKRHGKRLNISAIEEVCRQSGNISDCRVLQSPEHFLIAFIIVDYDGFVVSSSNQLSSKLPSENMDCHEQIIPSQSGHSLMKTSYDTRSEVKTGNTPRAYSETRWETVKSHLMHVLKETLPSQYMPDFFVEVNEAFPVTPHGKLDKQTLLDMASLVQTDSGLLVQSLPTWAASLWQTHLPTNNVVIKTNDNWLSLGGDSLAAVRVINILEKIFHTGKSNVDFVDIIFNRTFGDFIQSLKACSSNNSSKNLEEDIILKDSKVSLLHQNTLSEDEPKIHTVRNSFSFYKKMSFDELADLTYENRDTDLPLNSENKVQSQIPHSSSIMSKKGAQTFSMEVVNLIINRGCKMLYLKNQQTDDFGHPKPQNLGYQNSCRDIEGDKLPSSNKYAPQSPNGYLDESFKQALEENERTGKTCPYNSYQSTSKSCHLKIAWKYDTRKCVDASPAVMVINGQKLAVTGSHSGHICAINLDTGQAFWTIDLPDRIESSVCCTLDCKFIVVGCYDNGIYSLNAQSGKVEWCYFTQDIVKCSPTLNVNSSHVMCGSHDGQIYCLDIENKTCIWQKCLDGGGILASPLINQVTNIVYVATLRGKLVALQCSNGQRIWTTDLKKPTFSTPCFHHSSILIGSIDNALYCISEKGNIEWKFDTEGPVFSSPVSTGGFILFGCHDKRLYCLTSSGQLKWSMLGDSTLFSTPFASFLPQIKSQMPRQARNKSEIRPPALLSHQNNQLQSFSVTQDISDSCFLSGTLSTSVKQASVSVEDSLSFTSMGHSNLSSIQNDTLLLLKKCPEKLVDEDAMVCHGPPEKKIKIIQEKTLPNDPSTDCTSSSSIKDRLCSETACQVTSTPHHQGSTNSNPVNQTLKNKLDLPEIISKVNVATMSRPIAMNEHIQVVAIASSKGMLYVIELEGGSILTQTQLPGEVFSSPVMYENKLVIGCRNDFIYCYEFVT